MKKYFHFIQVFGIILFQTSYAQAQVSKSSLDVTMQAINEKIQNNPEKITLESIFNSGLIIKATVVKPKYDIKNEGILVAANKDGVDLAKKNSCFLQVRNIKDKAQLFKTGRVITFKSEGAHPFDSTVTRRYSVFEDHNRDLYNQISTASKNGKLNGKIIYQDEEVIMLEKIEKVKVYSQFLTSDDTSVRALRLSNGVAEEAALAGSLTVKTLINNCPNFKFSVEKGEVEVAHQKLDASKIIDDLILKDVPATADLNVKKERNEPKAVNVNGGPNS